MSGKLAIMAGLAVVFGATSYYAGNQYLETQAQARMDQLGSARPAIETVDVVVATDALGFGDTLNAENLRLAPWPKDSLPDGAFTAIDDVVGEGERRVLKAIARNEPLIAAKLSGEDGRAGLSGLIAEGMRAVTIPVDSVKGVGGFVQPGDHVDIVFTQRDRKTGEQVAKIIMEKVKVLTVDQQADSSGSPLVAKTVTLETDAAGAQKLALASEVGRLSLLLRSIGDEAEVGKQVISFDGMGSADPGAEVENPADPDAGQDGFLSFLNRESPTRTVRVVRGEEVQEQTVPVQQQIDSQKR